MADDSTDDRDARRRARAARLRKKTTGAGKSESGSLEAGAGEKSPENSDRARKIARAKRSARKKKQRGEEGSAEAGTSQTPTDTPQSEEMAKKRARAKRVARKKRSEPKASARNDRSAEENVPQDPQTGDDADSAGSSKRKASRASRAKRKNRTKKKETSAASDGDVSPEDKSARKAARASRKAERGESESEESSDRTRRRKALAARRKRKKGKEKGDGGADEESGPRPLRIFLNGLNETSQSALRQAIERKLAGQALEWPAADQKADIAFYAFDDPQCTAAGIAAQAADIADRSAKLHIFLARTDGSSTDAAADNRAIAVLAGMFKGAVVELDVAAKRYGADVLLANGHLTTPGADYVATAVISAWATGGLAKHAAPRLSQNAPPDLIEARILAITPSELFSRLVRGDEGAPKLLWTKTSKESLEAFLDRKIALSEGEALTIEPPIAWPERFPDRGTEFDILGLEFLSGPLNYWYTKASGQTRGPVAEIDAVMKERGAVASEILARAGAIILDFTQKHPLAPTEAWKELVASRRVRVLALFVLCCKMAAKRKVKFDEAVFTAVFGHLLDLIEVLRSDDYYRPCSLNGVEQDCLLIGLALVLRGTPYADRLLQESLDRLKTLQLDAGLTADGVWRFGSFADHISLLTRFKTLLADFDKSDAALIEPFAAVARKMTVFAEAMLKSDGVPPALDESRQKSYAKKLSGTRRALAGSGFSKSSPPKSKTASMPRVTDTYVFRDAQYFISHSTQKPVPDSSLVVVHAEAPDVAQSDPGGVSLAFAYGASDMLARGTSDDEKPRRRNGADPAHRNSYRFAETESSQEEPRKQASARLVKSWRGPGWAAVKSIDETNSAGTVARVVIHLKAHHALIVADELTAASGTEHEFEQLWHLAPGVSALEHTGGSLQFALAAGGNVGVAFDAKGKAITEPEGEGMRIIRTLQFAKGVAGSLFQWSAVSAPLTLEMSQGEGRNWTLAAAGGGFSARIALAGDELSVALS